MLITLIFILLSTRISEESTMEPTMEPTTDPTIEPTLAPTRRLCDGAKYQNKMFGFRNDSLWPQQEFVSNHCRCKLILHKNGSLTLYGKVDEFDDFVAGWSTDSKIQNYSGVSVPKFNIKIDGTIIINEYYYAPHLPPIPIWSIDIVDENIHGLDEKNNNFSFHLTDKCCLSIRDDDDYIYWSVCANITDLSDGSTKEDKTKFINSLWLISGCLCILSLSICMFMVLNVHGRYRKRCNEQKMTVLKCAETPTVDTNCNTKKKDLGKCDSYYFDDETTKQIELWGNCKLENNENNENNKNNHPIPMQSTHSTHL